MFIIFVDYKKPLVEVEKHLAAHREFLDRHYAEGTLLCSGPRNPRTGGIILCRAANREAVEAITAQDPFYINEIADYSVLEFSPTKHLPGFEAFL